MRRSAVVWLCLSLILIGADWAQASASDGPAAEDEQAAAAAAGDLVCSRRGLVACGRRCVRAAVPRSCNGTCITGAVACAACSTCAAPANGTVVCKAAEAGIRSKCSFQCGPGFRKQGKQCVSGTPSPPPPPPPPPPSPPLSPPPPAPPVMPNVTTGLQPGSNKTTGTPRDAQMRNFTSAATRALRIRGLGGRGKGRGGGGGRRRSSLLNVTCGWADKGAEVDDVPCPEYLDALLLALAPQSYASDAPADTGGFAFISPAQNQRDCAACVAMAATAAAEAAIAVARRESWPGSVRLSEQDLAFCRMGVTVSCKLGSSFDSLVGDVKAGRLGRWASRNEVPFTGVTSGIKCGEHGNTLPAGGSLQMVDAGNALDSLGRVKEAIVLHGGVMTSLLVWPHLKAYPPPDGLDVYNTTSYPAEGELHAVFCFGWNDTSTWNEAAQTLPEGLQGHLLCKNSWGRQWGLNGTFNIAYGSASVLPPDYTFAMQWQQDARAQAAADLLNRNSVSVEDPAYPGCWLFSPPWPMRLLHLAEELWHAGAGEKMAILKDVIISNLDYDGRGTAANISAGAAATADDSDDSATSGSRLLTQLVMGRPAGSSDGSASTFLICFNSSRGVIVGRPVLPPPPAPPSPPPPPPPPLPSCAAGTEPDPETYACTTCLAGFYKDMEGPHACTACDAGFATTGSSLPEEHDERDDCFRLAVVSATPFMESFRHTLVQPDARSTSVTEGKSFELRCLPGRYVTGFSGKSGSLVDSLSITCSDGSQQQAVGGLGGGAFSVSASPGGVSRIEFHASDTLGVVGVSFKLASGLQTRRFGLGDTSLQRSNDCPGQQRIIGVRGWVAREIATRIDYIAALGGICGKPVPFDRNIRSLPPVPSNVAGRPFDGASSTCPAGEFVVEVKGWGSLMAIERLQVVCSNGPELPSVGGSGGSAFPTASAQQLGAPLGVSGLSTFLDGSGKLAGIAFLTTAGGQTSVLGAVTSSSSQMSCPPGQRVVGLSGLVSNVQGGSGRGIGAVGVVCGSPATCPGLPTSEPTHVSWLASCSGATPGTVCWGTCAEGTATSGCTVAFGWQPGAHLHPPRHQRVPDLG